MIPFIDRVALEAYLAATKGTPDEAIALQFLPKGVVKTQGGQLSSQAADLAKAVRPKN